MEVDEATRKRIIEQQRKAMNDLNRGYIGRAGSGFGESIADLVNSKWTWRVAVFILALFLGNFLAQSIFQAGIEYGRNSCGQTTLYKNK